MAYTASEIKVLAYNFEEKPDFNWAERHLFIGCAYCYEWFRANPADKEECEKLLANYLDVFETMQKYALQEAQQAERR